MLLKDKVAVITGGAGLNGLGFATARTDGRARCARGASWTWPAPSRPPLPRGSVEGHLGLVADVTDKASCEAAAAEVLKAFGRIDILVNNAGITQPVEDAGHHRRRLRPHPRREPARHAVHVAGRAAGDARAKERLHRLHLVGLGAARRRHPRRPALLGGQGRRARPGASDGARVRSPTASASTASRPGLIDTDIIKGKLTEEKKAEIAETIPLARLGRADDIGGACVFLASDLSLLLHRHHARRERRHVDSLNLPNTPHRRQHHATQDLYPHAAGPGRRRHAAAGGPGPDHEAHARPRRRAGQPAPRGSGQIRRGAQGQERRPYRGAGRTFGAARRRRSHGDRHAHRRTRHVGQLARCRGQRRARVRGLRHALHVRQRGGGLQGARRPAWARSWPTSRPRRE